MPVEEVETVLLVAPLDDDAAAFAHSLLGQHLHLLEQEDGRGQGEQLLGQNALTGSKEPHFSLSLLSGGKDVTDWTNNSSMTRIAGLKT